MKKKSLLASIVVCAAVFLICAVPVLAADETYAAIHGGTVALSHELVMDKNATTVHGAKFKFSVAGSNVKAAGDPVYLVKGPNGATVTESVTYSNADVAGASVDEDAGTKTATKEIAVNFSNVNFTDVGIYRYALTQTLDSGSDIVPDEISTRYIDVAVIDDGEDRLKIESVVVRTAPDTASSKSDRLTNAYTGSTVNTLTVVKHVSGNLSSGNKYFRFTVTLTKEAYGESGEPAAITDTTPINISGLDSDLSSVSFVTKYSAGTINSANSADVTCASLGAGQDFYLKEGQSLVLAGIPEGYGYTVTEAPEDYQPAVAVSGDTDYAEKSRVRVTDPSNTRRTQTPPPR